MIPVALQPEPAGFDAQVRQAGLAWLAARGVALAGPLPKKTAIPAYWSQRVRVFRARPSSALERRPV